MTYAGSAESSDSALELSKECVTSHSICQWKDQHRDLGISSYNGIAGHDDYVAVVHQALFRGRSGREPMRNVGRASGCRTSRSSGIFLGALPRPATGAQRRATYQIRCTALAF